MIAFISDVAQIVRRHDTNYYFSPAFVMKNYKLDLLFIRTIIWDEYEFKN